MLAGRYADSISAAEAAARVAEAAEARRELWVAETLLSTSLALAGRVTEAQAVLRTSQSLDHAVGEAAGPRPSRIIDHIGALLSEAMVLEQAGELGAAVDLSLKGEDLARRLGVESTLGGLTAAAAARRLFDIGRWDEAEALIEATIARGLPSPTRDVDLHTTRALLASARGDIQNAETAIQAAEQASTPAVPDRILARRLLAQAELKLLQRHPLQAQAIVDVGLRKLSIGEDRQAFLALAAVGVRAAADQAASARDHRSRQDEVTALEYADGLLAKMVLFQN